MDDGLSLRSSFSQHTNYHPYFAQTNDARMCTIRDNIQSSPNGSKGIGNSYAVGLNRQSVMKSSVHENGSSSACRPESTKPRFRHIRLQSLWILRCLFFLIFCTIMVSLCYVTMAKYMTPHIESLLEQRYTLEKEIQELNNQITNLSSISERQDRTIRILQKQIARQQLMLQGKSPEEDGREDGDRQALILEESAQAASMLFPIVLIASSMIFCVAYRIYHLVLEEYAEGTLPCFEHPTAPRLSTRSSTAHFTKGTTSASLPVTLRNSHTVQPNVALRKSLSTPNSTDVLSHPYWSYFEQFTKHPRAVRSSSDPSS